MAEPRGALEVGVDDEHHDRDRPQPADDGVELEHGDEVDGEREQAERADVGARQRPRRELPTGRPRVAGVDLGVHQPVEPHRERPRADHRDGDPRHPAPARPPVHREQRSDVGERQREHRVLEPDEPGEPQRERCGDGAHAGSFVFSTSVISSIRISLSTAFAMS